MCSLFPNLETPKVRVICNYIVRLEISAAEIMHTFQKEQHLGLKTFESAESAESASPFQRFKLFRIQKEYTFEKLKRSKCELLTFAYSFGILFLSLKIYVITYMRDLYL